MTPSVCWAMILVMMAQIMTSDSTLISVDEWWWWWWCVRLFVSSLPSQAYTASSPRRTNEMTIGGSPWAPSLLHTHTRRPRLSEDTPGASGPKHLRINRINYEHPRRPGAVNRPHTADRETHQRGWAAAQRPRARLLAVSPTILSCVEWTRRRAWSQTMEQVDGP